MSLQTVSVVLVIWDGSLMFGLPHASEDRTSFGRIISRMIVWVCADGRGKIIRKRTEELRSLEV